MIVMMHLKEKHYTKRQNETNIREVYLDSDKGSSHLVQNLSQMQVEE